MIKKFLLYIIIFSLLSVSNLLSQSDKVTVIVEKASIYAEANENSYEIDRAKMGDVLTLFEPWTDEKEWLYVVFRSERWGGEVTGFIKSSQVVRGEIIPEELVKKTATESKAREPEPEEGESEKKDEFPSLKEAFKSKEKEAVEKAEQEETKAGDEPVQPAEKQKAVEIKIDTFLGETETLESRMVESPDLIGNESSIYEIKKSVPPVTEMEVAEARIESKEEFKSKEVLPSPAEEEPEAKLEAKSEPDLEIKPIRTEVSLGESEMPRFRDVAPPETLTLEPRAYAVISTRVEYPLLERREKDIKVVTETQPAQVEIEPYEIKTEAQEIPPVPQQKPPPELSKPELPAARKVGPFAMSVGFGPSYGGLGASLQLNTKSGFSIHAGVGYYPAKLNYSQFDWLENQVLFSAGIKYYFPFKHAKFRPYLNLQYGGLTVEAVQVPTGIWYGEKTYENVQKNLYGPSLLAGTEWRLGRMGLNGALGLSYNTTEWEYWERDLFFNGEFAIIVYF